MIGVFDGGFRTVAAGILRMPVRSWLVLFVSSVVSACVAPDEGDYFTTANGGAQAGGGAAAGGTGAGTGGTGATGGGAGGTTCTPPVAGGLCDTFPQCGCPNGQACDVIQFGSGITQCVQAGNVPPYNACNGSTTKCQAGYACIGGACKSFCETVTGCSATGGDCLQVTNIDSTPVPQMKICSKKCLLENPSADCGPTLSCWLTDPVAGKTDCTTGGTGIGAVNCTDNTTCAPAHVCLKNVGRTVGQCWKWCRVGVTVDCPVGKACTAWEPPDQVFVGTTQYGVCAL